MHTFTQDLLKWWQQNKRNLPWKNTKDAYKIWLSEIILQQTRVEQGLPYFLKFMSSYPSVHDLANAPQDEVMRLWQGLGYYSRARNLHATAKYVSQELGGQFPTSFKGLKDLKGVGDYTAAAIASFAFDLPHAVVDGNVYRVLARYFNISTPIDTTQGKKEFTALANKLLPTKQAANFNQAIMDFGATQCKPAAPLCASCLLQANCLGLAHKTIGNLPIKSKKLKRKERFFNFFIISTPSKQTFIHKRMGKDIWQNLYQFPLIEGNELLSEKALYQHNLWQFLQKKQLQPQLIAQSKTYKQLLTHQCIYASFFEIGINSEQLKALFDYNLQICNKQNIATFAFPKIITDFFDDYWLSKQQQLSIF